eukprot:TRINITY_DN6407_c0_g1_i2.p1 TRINITY_DN6407_c0_g1~~TRINITY_DN6407_c0_g1_i2.p1  ORF type:complete len:335 (-),score=51.16 TRINITY_DN6407_c0_g1_i2:41-1015(-)
MEEIPPWARCDSCKDWLSEPITLDCSHSFCKACIEASLARNGWQGCLQCKVQVPLIRTSSKQLGDSVLAFKTRALAAKLDKISAERIMKCTEAFDFYRSCVGSSTAESVLREIKTYFNGIRSAASQLEKQLSQAVSAEQTNYAEALGRYQSSLVGAMDLARNAQEAARAVIDDLHNTNPSGRASLIEEFTKDLLSRGPLPTLPALPIVSFSPNESITAALTQGASMVTINGGVPTAAVELTASGRAKRARKGPQSTTSKSKSKAAHTVKAFKQEKVAKETSERDDDYDEATDNMQMDEDEQDDYDDSDGYVFFLLLLAVVGCWY